MRLCENCGGGLYRGLDAHQIDEWLCRGCQKSPAVQMRVLLGKARERAMDFDRAYVFAFTRVRWPHDTNHRLEWKALLGDDVSARKIGALRRETARQRELWRACYERRQERDTLSPLVLVAA